MADLASFVRKRRLMLGLSLSQVAARAGCTKQHIHDIEMSRSGNPTVDTVCALAAGLQVDAVSLFRVAAKLSGFEREKDDAG